MAATTKPLVKAFKTLTEFSAMSPPPYNTATIIPSIIDAGMTVNTP